MLSKYLNAFWEHDVQATGDGESTAAHGPSRRKVSARLGGCPPRNLLLRGSHLVLKEKKKSNQNCQKVVN